MSTRVQTATSSTASVTYTQTTPLDSSYGHVLIVRAYSSSTTPTVTTPTGWTLVGYVDSTSGSFRVRLYVFKKRGDGVTVGSGTIASAGTVAYTFLAAYDGVTEDDFPVALTSYSLGSNRTSIAQSGTGVRTHQAALACVALYGTPGVGGIVYTSGTLLSGGGQYSSLGVAEISPVNVGTAVASTASWATSGVAAGALLLIGGSVQAPTVSLTAPQSVAAGAPFTATATAADDGSIVSYAWSVVAPSTASPTLTGGSTATVSGTAPSTVPSLVTLSCTVTDDAGLTATATTEVRVLAAGADPVTPLPIDPIATSSTAWTVAGGAASVGAALADTSDTTYAESPAALSTTEQWVDVRLGPSAGRSSATLDPLRLSVSTGTGTAIIRLVDAGGVRQTWTQAVTATPTDYVLGVDAAVVGTVDWTTARLRAGFTS